MSSTIQRTTTLVDGGISVEIRLVAKDAADDALIQKFGDIKINPSGQFGDPLDSAYPKFNVIAGDPVEFYTVGAIRALFVNDTLTLDDLQKRAKLWGDAVALNIQNQIVALRILNDTSTGVSTIVV
jgi:hypothetical protein